jgi:hypothetical protein
MDAATNDAQLRQTAFSHVNRLATLHSGMLDSADLAGGFDFNVERIPLINPQPTGAIPEIEIWRAAKPYGHPLPRGGQTGRR